MKKSRVPLRTGLLDETFAGLKTPADIKSSRLHENSA
jgi:hypothetical protein